MNIFCFRKCEFITGLKGGLKKINDRCRRWCERFTTDEWGENVVTERGHGIKKPCRYRGLLRYRPNPARSSAEPLWIQVLKEKSRVLRGGGKLTADHCTPPWMRSHSTWTSP